MKSKDLQEIKKADIRGAQEKEVEVAVDIYKMMASKVSFNDIIGTLKVITSRCLPEILKASGQRRTIRILGEIDNPAQLENFVVKTENGNAIYLKDVASVSFKEEDNTTFARKSGKPVVMLDVKKRAGKNMVDAAEQIQQIVEDAIANQFPPDLRSDDYQRPI